MAKYIGLLFLASLCCSGCLAVARILPPFDADQAEALLLPGKNAIAGRLSTYATQDGPMTLAPLSLTGIEVRLIPATQYANDRFEELFHNARGGACAGRILQVDPDPQRFHVLQRTTTTDPQGAFRFDGVADGEFWVVAAAYWDQHGTSWRGGGICGQRTIAGDGVSQPVSLLLPVR